MMQKLSLHMAIKRQFKWKKTPAKAFGEVLRELRVEKKLTQERLAYWTGTERSHISDFERAVKGPTLDTVMRLAQAIGIPAWDIVERVEQKLLGRKR